MKHVWVKCSTASRTASTTLGAALPTELTAMPEPRSINELPSMSTMTPPPASAVYTGNVEATPAATAACRRACRAMDLGPGMAVSNRRSCARSVRNAVVMARALLCGTDGGHHVLDAGVVLEAVHGQVFAVTGMTETTVRHFRHQGNVRVDPDAAEVQRP